MKAAIYARYSTDKQSESSITDQVRVCERLAERHCFEVVAKYQDAALSGGTTRRPGYQAMLTAARRGDFMAIVAEDSSRLWRALAEQSPRLAELADLGVAVVTHDLDTRQESAAIMGAVGGAMAEQYRREIGRRTRRGLEGRARQGKSAGGRAYGYIPPAISGTGNVEIDQAQAAIVREIFSMYADGHCPRAIAAELNRRGVPSPGSSWNRTARRRSGWLASAIAGDPARGIGILSNELYRGILIWNRSRWIRSASDSKRRRQELNPRSEWITQPADKLRIVTDELWQRVKIRQQRHNAGRGAIVKAGLERRRRAGGGRPARHLLSGLLKCGECGSSFTLASRVYYACAGYLNGRACSNGIHVRRELVEAKVIDGLRACLRDPAALAEAARRARKLLTERGSVRAIDHKRLATLRAEIEHLADAIAGGVLRRSPALANRLAETEAELARLEQLAARPVQVVRVAPGLPERVQAAVDHLDQTLAAADPERARAALADVLPLSGIRLTPDHSRAYLVAETEMETPLRLAAGGVSEIMVAGAGFEPATFGL